jgi:predicted PurR-regulated permease PerM
MASGIGYFLFFLVGFLVLTILLIWPVFPYVVLAILLAYLMHPLNRRLEKVISSAGARAALLTFFALIVFALPLVFAIRVITSDLAAVIQPERARELLERARVWLVNRQAELVANWMIETIAQVRDFLVGSIPSLFGSVFNISLGIFVCLFVFYYFTKEGAAIWSGFVSALPLPGKLKSEMSKEVTGIVRAIFYGQLLTALAQGIIGTLVLLVFQVPQAIVLGVLMTVLSFLPFVGTPLVWVPAGVLKLVAGDTWQGVGVLVFGAVVIMNVDNFLRPRLIAMHSQVHPVVILIGIIGGTKTFGFVGFLVGPVIFAIFLQLLRFFAEYLPAEATASPPSSA